LSTVEKGKKIPAPGKRKSPRRQRAALGKIEGPRVKNEKISLKLHPCRGEGGEDLHPRKREVWEKPRKGRVRGLSEGDCGLLVERGNPPNVPGGHRG